MTYTVGMMAEIQTGHMGVGRTAGQFLAIARTTVVESVQQPVALLIQLTAVMTTLLVPVFEFHRFNEEGRLARDSGLSCMLVFGLVLAVGTAGRSVADEITRGTAAAAIGKPVARTTFVLAKWLGVCGVVAIFWCGLLAATLVAERSAAHFVVHGAFAGYLIDYPVLALAVGGVAVALALAAAGHFFLRRRFGVTAFFGVTLAQLLMVGLCAGIHRFRLPFAAHAEAACCDEHGASAVDLACQVGLNGRVVAAAVLVLLALLVFSALATALATRLPTGAALAVCVLALGLGLAGDGIAVHAPVFSARGVLAGLLPDVQHFWLCDAVAHGGRIQWSYVLEVAGYTLTCCALFLTAGCLAFRDRDLG